MELLKTRGIYITGMEWSAQIDPQIRGQLTFGEKCQGSLMGKGKSFQQKTLKQLDIFMVGGLWGAAGTIERAVSPSEGTE